MLGESDNKCNYVKYFNPASIKIQRYKVKVITQNLRKPMLPLKAPIMKNKINTLIVLNKVRFFSSFSIQSTYCTF